MVGTLIEKEEIGKYKIIPADINRVVELNQKLSNAQRLGNEFKSKVAIIFQTENGPKRIETTVWSLTDNYIQIKSGVLIPLISLISVEF
ncbi:hypothetical protein FAZ19_16405 [Sphingobacterium alkalisoli]|uniref:Uncharacterized protein n=1 Tax=Sphingobacterium alkalisoli TaxID=1874115 RepID=A0A4U0GXS4_9SPHI|nr:hypothetical protein [Sphingobacterium alkalisoli]TJY63846.1 hypothetical protein FAZ19_16405 [Sphingobacterium alkalisoli]GGH24498.1 hypothetical protein GCM10011418_32460 [Sphingobacterium alkalisoli]